MNPNLPWIILACVVLIFIARGFYLLGIAEGHRREKTASSDRWHTRGNAEYERGYRAGRSETLDQVNSALKVLR